MSGTASARGAGARGTRASSGGWGARALVAAAVLGLAGGGYVAYGRLSGRGAAPQAAAIARAPSLPPGTTDGVTRVIVRSPTEIDVMVRSGTRTAIRSASAPAPMVSFDAPAASTGWVAFEPAAAGRPARLELHLRSQRQIVANGGPGAPPGR